MVVSGLMGGGAVKKHQLKSKKISKNTAADKTVYDTAYNTALTIDTASNFDLKSYMGQMSKDKLEDIKDYLTTDRSNYATKLKNLHTCLTSYGELQMVINKATVAMETLQSLLSKDIENTFGLDDAKEAIEGVKGLLTEVIAVKTYQESQEMDARL